MDDFQIAAGLTERWSRERKYLVGVSGGRDSVALLHLLHSAGYRNLVVCHLNHGLRTPDSDHDADFVRNLADELGHPAEIGQADVGELAEARKKSIETAAREARHEFFARNAGQHDCREVFLAHHADDQIETVLINLCRGTGPRGLAGMKTENSLRVGDTVMTLIRPLLEIRRSEIDAWVRKHGLPYREDSSNAENLEHTRNRVRHELIPLMEEIFSRDPGEAILRLSQVVALENEEAETTLDESWPELTDERMLIAERVLSTGPASQRRIIHRWLSLESGLPACGFREVEAVRGILPPSETRARVNLPGGWHARRREGRLFLQPPEKD